MGYTANKLIQLALAEVGYLEKKSASELDSKTANAGKNNYTKYARDLAKAGYYQASKQGTPWCSVFVDWLHYMASGKDKATAQRVSCQSGPYGAGCGYSMGYYKKAGCFHTSDPRPGDQIYFGSGASCDHTGVVYQVDKQYVYTVEGNTSGQAGVVGNGGGVFKKQYALDNKKILGYGRPDYDAQQEETKPETATTKKGDFSVEMRVLKNGCKGEDVRALQILMIGNGCTCGVWGADGNFGSGTEAAVRNYQKKNKLQVDGKAGPQTWGNLLGAT